MNAIQQYDNIHELQLKLLNSNISATQQWKLQQQTHTCNIKICLQYIIHGLQYIIVIAMREKKHNQIQQYDNRNAIHMCDCKIEALMQ